MSWGRRSLRGILVTVTLLIVLVEITHGQIGTTLCACSPASYTFEVRFDRTCPGDLQNEQGGIANSDCNLNNAEDGPNMDFNPVTVSNIFIAELNENLQPWTITRYESASGFKNGSRIVYSSVVGTDPNISAFNLTRGFQSVLFGRNAQEIEIENNWIIEFTNECGVFPLFTVGDTIGWLQIVDFTNPVSRYCPGVPSAAPTELPTESPITGFPTQEPTDFPNMLPSFSPTGVPSFIPSHIPSLSPTTEEPTLVPTFPPTLFPTTFPPTLFPTKKPTILPNNNPSTPPTIKPSPAPTRTDDTKQPSSHPSASCPPIIPSKGKRSKSPKGTKIPSKGGGKKTSKSPSPKSSKIPSKGANSKSSKLNKSPSPKSSKSPSPKSSKIPSKGANSKTSKSPSPKGNKASKSPGPKSGKKLSTTIQKKQDPLPDKGAKLSADQDERNLWSTFDHLFEDSGLSKSRDGGSKSLKNSSKSPKASHGSGKKSDKASSSPSPSITDLPTLCPAPIISSRKPKSSKSKKMEKIGSGKKSKSPLATKKKTKAGGSVMEKTSKKYGEGATSSSPVSKGTSMSPPPASKGASTKSPGKGSKKSGSTSSPKNSKAHILEKKPTENGKGKGMEKLSRGKQPPSSHPIEYDPFQNTVEMLVHPQRR